MSSAAAPATAAAPPPPEHRPRHHRGHESNGRGRFRSVRTKATSFSGWRESVRSACGPEDDLDLLVRGTRLWKVRRKAVQGLVCYQRAFRLDVDTLCIHYNSESAAARVRAPWRKGPGGGGGGGGAAAGQTSSIDVANVVEVRQGFSTDTFNEVEKKVSSTHF